MIHISQHYHQCQYLLLTRGTILIIPLPLWSTMSLTLTFTIKLTWPLAPTLATNNSPKAQSCHQMMYTYQQWISLVQPSRNTWVLLMWPFTYTVWSLTYIPLIFNLKPLFPLLCNEGIVIFYSYNCNYLWFPLLCNKDYLVLSDLPDLQC